MQETELSAGPIEYEDSGGEGPVIVFVGGLAMNTSMWRNVVRELAPEHRCISLNLPLGGHRKPMRRDADLTLHGLARIESEFLEALDLRGVTLVGNDSGAFQITAVQQRERIARLVITSCEAFENYPPGFAGRLLCTAAKLPGGMNLIFQPMRIRPLRRLPFGFGAMSRRPVPDEVMDEWLRPLLTQRAVRRDLTKYLRSCREGEMLEAAQLLRSFDRPVLVAWSSNDRMMPPEHGRRFAELLPNARLVEIADSATLVSEDQPAALAGHIRAFVASAVPAA